MKKVREAILALVVGIPLIIFLLVIGYFVYLYLGWLLILLWLITGASTAGPTFSFVLISFAVYGLTALALVLKPDVSGLPPALKFLAQFLPAPLKREGGSAVDLPDLAKRTKASVLSPFTNLEKKFQAWRYQKAAEELRTDTEYQKAQADLHRAAQEFNRAKLRAEEAERARRGHD
jgi:hypothetical protein